VFGQTINLGCWLGDGDGGFHGPEAFRSALNEI
jgi:hypothetical protein